MTAKKINTAQELLAHIALKTKDLEIFESTIKARQWTASERFKFLALTSNSEDDTMSLLRNQASVVALSLVGDDNEPMFPIKEWINNKPVFVDEKAIDQLIENQPDNTVDAFIKIGGFNGLKFSNSTIDDNEEEEQAVKN
jgi:hypothetical protein